MAKLHLFTSINITLNYVDNMNDHPPLNNENTHTIYLAIKYPYKKNGSNSNKKTESQFI